jgi:hypothetical protein
LNFWWKIQRMFSIFRWSWPSRIKIKCNIKIHHRHRRCSWRLRGTSLSKKIRGNMIVIARYIIWVRLDRKSITPKLTSIEVSVKKEKVSCRKRKINWKCLRLNWHLYWKKIG